MTSKPTTHRAYEYSIVGAHGERQGPFVEYVHSSRHCENCTHFGPHDPDWNQAVEAGEKLLKCLCDCWAADEIDPNNRFCPDHQSRPEFDALVNRPQRPVFALVKVSE